MEVILATKAIKAADALVAPLLSFLSTTTTIIVDTNYFKINNYIYRRG
jgi:hypothetical protein